jgi:hypothetical protein
MPVILATQKAEIRRMEVQSQQRQIVCETLPQNKTKRGLVEWLKVEAPSSSPSSTEKQQKKLGYCY